jgi:hypothetical protein
MTKQQLFDKVATHLLTQNRKATDGKEACLYRGPGGTMCAVGCLMTNAQYEEFGRGYEGKPVMCFEIGHLRALGVEDENQGLVKRLQTIHDFSYVDRWRDELRELAVDFRLSTAVLDTVREDAVNS